MVVERLPSKPLLPFYSRSCLKGGVVKLSTLFQGEKESLKITIFVKSKVYCAR